MKKEWLLFQLIDSALPTGAFAHSFGLETTFQEGKINSTTELFTWAYQYISGVLAPMEGIAVNIAHRVVEETLTNGETTVEHEQILTQLDQRLTVSKMASESQKGAVKLGKRYLDVVNRLYPESGLQNYGCWIDSGICYGNPAVVHGWIAAYLHIPLDMAIFTHLYSSINMLLQSALRMTIVGQTNLQLVLQKLHPTMMEVAEKTASDTFTIDDLSSFNILQEIESMRHETLYSRLFMS